VIIEQTMVKTENAQKTVRMLIQTATAETTKLNQISKKNVTNEQIMEILKNDVKLIAKSLILKNQIVEMGSQTHEKIVMNVLMILEIAVKDAVEIE
jgi:arsenate reductase-like glutaredoxin family protein